MDRMNPSLIERLRVRGRLCGPDGRGFYWTVCPLHGCREWWFTASVAHIACQPEHVPDWCPACAAGSVPEPPSAA